MTDDVRKLLGGYATGTLTEAERQQLFSAALEDQALFEALADEQALAELLEDPSARATLLNAVENPGFSLTRVFGEWFSRPKAKVLVALGCVAMVGIAIRAQWERTVGLPSEMRKAPPAVAQPDTRGPFTLPAPRPEERNLVRVAPGPSEPQGESRPNVTRKVGGTAATAPPAAAVTARNAESMATAPPPPPPRTKAVADAESATRTFTAAGIDMQLTLLRRTAEGADVPVPASYPFAASDRVRLRMQANQDGTFQVRRNGNPMYTGAASAGTPIVIPAELVFTDVAVNTVDIRFSPMPSAGVSRLEFRDSQSNAQSSATAARVAATPVTGVNAQLVLRRATE